MKNTVTYHLRAAAMILMARLYKATCFYKGRWRKISNVLICGTLKMVTIMAAACIVFYPDNIDAGNVTFITAIIGSIVCAVLIAASVFVLKRIDPTIYDPEEEDE